MKIILINRYRKVKWKKIKSDMWQAKKGSGDKNKIFYDNKEKKNVGGDPSQIHIGKLSELFGFNG